MPRFKMIGKDINAPPVLFSADWETASVYRTWIVDDEPDYTGEQYTGLKSGDSPLADIVAYEIPEGQILDFNLPDPTVWKTTRKVLPGKLYDSQAAVIDGYAYLFGGAASDKIYRASTNTPIDWVDTEATLPEPLFGSQLAVIDGYIYLFGGCDEDGYITDVIYRATTADPLTWEDTGSVLPDTLNYSQLSILDGYVYLYGGRHAYNATDVIYRASVDDPTVWIDTGDTLPNPIYGHQCCIADGYVWLIGGLDSSKNQLSSIYRASISDPTQFELNDGYLKYPSAFGQIAFVGNDVGTKIYYLGGYGDGSILAAKLDNHSDPSLIFEDTGKDIPGTVTHSQLAIINDRLYLLGGNGSTIIWAASNKLKFDLSEPEVLSYGEMTRYVFDTTDPLDLFKVLGFAPWKTDYGS
jgi:hypothetical protein